MHHRLLEGSVGGSRVEVICQSMGAMADISGRRMFSYSYEY